MFEYIRNEELKILLNKIQNNDKSIEDIGNSLKLIKLFNTVSPQENTRLIKDILNSKPLLKYFCTWVKGTSLSSIDNKKDFRDLIKTIFIEAKDLDIKSNMIEIYLKLDFEKGISIATKTREEEIQELIFERVLDLIKKDRSLNYLKVFVSILKIKSNEFKDGTIFDFIEVLSKLSFNAKTFYLFDELLNYFKEKDKYILNELTKVKYSKFEASKEYQQVNNILEKNTGDLVDSDLKLIAYSINANNIKDIIKVLEYLQNEELFLELINTIIYSEDIDIDKEKIIQIIASKKLYMNDTQENFVKKYIKQNNIQMNKFEKEYCEDDYINSKIELIISYSNNEEIEKIKQILKSESDSEILKEVSVKVIESILENEKLNILIKLWDEFKLPISSKLQYGEQVKKLITSHNEINEDTIQFLIDMDLDDISVYKNIKDDKSKNILLNIWRKNNKNGKVVDVIKYKIDVESQTIEDLKTINKMIELYNINDNRLKTYLKLKVYSKIELELLELDPMDSNDALKLDNIIDLVIEYNLESRLLNDKYILDILDKEIKDSIAKKVINKSQSEDVLNAFWNRVDESIRMGRKQHISENIKIILPCITESKEKIGWFLELLEKKNYNHSTIERIIEVCLETMGRNRNIINQLSKDLEDSKPAVTLDIARSLGASLARLEQSIINIKDENQKNIIISNMKNLRRSLSNVGIDTVEALENYNKEVELNEDKHAIKGNLLDHKGLVETLGVKVNDMIIAKSMLGDIGEVDVIE